MRNNKPGTNASVEAAQKIIIFVADIYEDLEVHYPRLRLIEAGFRSVIVGIGKASYAGKYGYPINVDLQAEEVKAGEYSGCVIPGGFAPDKLRMNSSVLNIVRALHNAGKPVAAICHGGWVLVSAGILKGKRVTSYLAIKDDLENAGAEWVNEETVVDGNLITARHPGDLPSFTLALINALKPVSIRK